MRANLSTSQHMPNMPYRALIFGMISALIAFSFPGHKFVDELDRVLGIADEAERSKKLKQFQEWDTNIHSLIQARFKDGIFKIMTKERRISRAPFVMA